RDKLYAKFAERRISEIDASAEHEFLITPSKREEPRIPFGIVLERGFLKPGDILLDERKRHKARVRADSTLMAKDQRNKEELRGSIHKVGALVQGLPACNGWTFWCYDSDGRGGLASIDLLRQRIRAEAVGNLR